ncbi:hypothetical protein Tco_1291817 [Tanacetum coccineum]
MSHSTISIPSDSARKSIESSPSLVILSDTEAEVLAIPVALPSIAPKAAAATVVSLPTVTGDLAIRTDLEAEPSKAPPFPDYIEPPPPVQISATLPTSPTMPASVGPSRKRCRSPPLASAVPPPDVSSPHRRSSLPPSDTTAEAVILEFVIPEPMAPVFLVRRRRAMRAKAQVVVLRGLLRISRVRIADLEFRAEDAEDRLEQCEREWIHDRARIRRFEEHLGIRQ